MIQVFLGDSFENGNSEPLSHFSCIGSQKVETNDLSSLSSVNHHFGISVLRSVVIQIPLQRLVYAAIRQNILLSEFLSRFFFAVAATTVLNRREYSGRHVLVTHCAGTFAKESVSQQLSCHDGRWGKFQPACTDVPNSINVGY